MKKSIKHLSWSLKESKSIKTNLVPSDANIIDNIDPPTGSWKALIIYDPNNEYGAGAMEFLNVVLAGAAESLSPTLDWYQIFWSNEGESFDGTDMEDGIFSGATVFNAPASPVTAAQPKPVPQPQFKTKAQPQKHTPPVAPPKTKSVAAPKRNGGRNAMCIVLSVLLVVQVAAVAHYGWPGLMVSDNSAVVETEKAIASVENASVTLCGVRIDVNPLNLIGGEKELIVSRKKQSSDEATGLTSVEYDISLGDMHHPNAPLTLTVPYDKTTAAGGDVALLYYNSDYELWIPQGTANNGDGTVTASLTSLSPVKLVYLGNDYPSGVFFISQKGTSNAKMEVRIALTQPGIDLHDSKGNDRTTAVNLYKNIFSGSGSL